MILSSESLGNLVETLSALEERRDSLNAEISALRQMLTSQLDVGEIAATNSGDPVYRLMPGRRTFKEEKAFKLLPQEVLAECWTPRIDGSKVREASEELWAQCCNIGEPFLQAIR